MSYLAWIYLGCWSPTPDKRNKQRSAKDEQEASFANVTFGQWNTMDWYHQQRRCCVEGIWSLNSLRDNHTKMGIRHINIALRYQIGHISSLLLVLCDIMSFLLSRCYRLWRVHTEYDHRHSIVIADVYIKRKLNLSFKRRQVPFPAFSTYLNV
jgi:hypothetical protein